MVSLCRYRDVVDATASPGLQSVIQGGLCTSYWAMLFPLQWNSTCGNVSTRRQTGGRIVTAGKHVNISLAAGSAAGHRQTDSASWLLTRSVTLNYTLVMKGQQWWFDENYVECVGPRGGLKKTGRKCLENDLKRCIGALLQICCVVRNVEDYWEIAAVKAVFKTSCCLMWMTAVSNVYFK